MFTRILPDGSEVPNCFVLLYRQENGKVFNPAVLPGDTELYDVFPSWKEGEDAIEALELAYPLDEFDLTTLALDCEGW